jgi:hypothetical protein
VGDDPGQAGLQRCVHRSLERAVSGGASVDTNPDRRVEPGYNSTLWSVLWQPRGESRTLAYGRSFTSTRPRPSHPACRSTRTDREPRRAARVRSMDAHALKGGAALPAQEALRGCEDPAPRWSISCGSICCPVAEYPAMHLVLMGEGTSVNAIGTTPPGRSHARPSSAGVGLPPFSGDDSHCA